ncbi:MAG: hypothetical protein ACFFB3_00735 [Candidatus Hodarchaeota archaeon]
MEVHRIDQQTKEKLFGVLAENAAKDKKEVARFLFAGTSMGVEDELEIWVVKLHQRSMMETTARLEDFPSIPIRTTYVKPDFFLDIANGVEDVPFWQIATVMRLISNCEMIYDPQDFMKTMIEKLRHLEWAPSLIELKRSTAKVLQEKSLKALQEDMMADAYIWAIKGIEEAICVPLMLRNLFSLGTPTLLLDSLQSMPELKKQYVALLGADQFKPFELENALKELDRVATHLYHQQPPKSDREMWILSGFVSINASERLLKQCYQLLGTNSDNASLVNRYFETAVAEYWQALFLCAQTPNKFVPLDPWIVSIFWKWLARSKSEEEIIRISKNIEKIADPTRWSSIQKPWKNQG